MIISVDLDESWRLRIGSGERASEAECISYIERLIQADKDGKLRNETNGDRMLREFLEPPPSSNGD